MLVFYDDELTTFRKKIIDLFVMLKKGKKSFMEYERDIGSMKIGHFKHLFNSRWFLTELVSFIR